ncbi:hypothetical protein IFM89_028219 [Coptis chinensis]|uniref:SMODS and SLOG-associating 2TM effector domain-containing protein n=1 Tax=Coptis chinensis TaxID=261450 RepID=A0A835IPK4_9MAGN|nr:hypothetical protein IFM89_028219 [Coptis chinensis]
MDNSTRNVQQLSQEQSERVQFCERMKCHYRKEGVELKKRATEIIKGLVKCLVIFLGSIAFHCRNALDSDAWPNFMTLILMCLIGVILVCLDTYHRINQIIKELDWLLKRDKVLRMDVDVLIKNVRDSMEMYEVESDFGEGVNTKTNIRILPHILDHGDSVLELALLKKSVKEPLVGLTFKFTYRFLVAVLFLFGMLFIIGLAAYSHCIMIDLPVSVTRCTMDSLYIADDRKLQTPHLN